MVTVWGLATGLLAGLLGVREAHAQDAFEIQVYDAATAAPGQVGIEVHLNHFVDGRKTVEDGEQPTHRATHLTFEPHVGIARWCEAGFYLVTNISSGGDYDLAGVKARFKMRIPRRLAGGLIGLAPNQELGSLRRDFEADQVGWELRPVIDLSWKRLYFSINPILDMPLSGPMAGHPEVEPAAKLALSIVDAVSIGAEYYASFGPIDAPVGLSDQVHRLFGAVDVAFRAWKLDFDLNLAMGYGLAAGDKIIAKAILAVDYRR